MGRIFRAPQSPWFLRETVAPYRTATALLVLATAALSATELAVAPRWDGHLPAGPIAVTLAVPPGPLDGSAFTALGLAWEGAARLGRDRVLLDSSHPLVATLSEGRLDSLATGLNRLATSPQTEATWLPNQPPLLLGPADESFRSGIRQVAGSLAFRTLLAVDPGLGTGKRDSLERRLGHLSLVVVDGVTGAPLAVCRSEVKGRRSDEQSAESAAITRGLKNCLDVLVGLPRRLREALEHEL